MSEPSSANPTDNAELLKRFMAEFLPAQRPVYQFVLVLVASVHDADDLMQDVSAILWERFAEFRPGTNFKAWAMKIAYLQGMRKRREANRWSGLLEPDVLEQLVDELEVDEGTLGAQIDALRGCLEDLRPADRDLVSHRYADGASCQDAAERVGRPVHSVHQSLYRMRRALLTCIETKLAAGEHPGGAG